MKKKKKKRFLLMMLFASMCAVSIAAQNVSPLDMSNALRLSDPVTIVNARVNQGLPRHGNHAPRYHYEREDQYCNSTISLDVATIRSLPVGEGVWLDVYVHRDDDCEVMTQVQFGFILPEGLQISDIKTHSDTESRFIGPYDSLFPEYNNYVIGETYNGYLWSCNMLNDTTFRAVGVIGYYLFDPSGIVKKDFNLCTIYIEKTKPLGPGAVIKVGNDMPFKYIAGPNGETIWSGAWIAANHIIDLGSIATDPVMSTGITLNKSELSLTTGAAETLVATVSPGNTTNKTVAWASSDTSVATVDTSGKVTAVGVGSCTITATTTDGSNLSATCTVTVRTSDSVTVEIGDGTGKSEVCPIHNWWLRSYQGNEVIYLKEELNLQPGDQITALSYHCVQGSAHGGNFNVRIKNTTLTQTFDGTEDPMDPSVLKVDYNDKVYGNVQLEPYGAGDWITFELSEPFVYEGENIIIDIRNTAPGNYSGWCYFATTKCSPRRSLGWRNAQDEQVSGFVDGYTPYGDYDSGFYIYNETSPYDTEGDYPNIRITYTPGTSSGDVRATGITLNKSELSLTAGATETLVATISPINTTNKTVTWASSNPAVATVDEDGLVTAKAYGTATITAATTDGSNLSATCTVTVRGVSDLYGDINNDGVVDIADVNILINLMLGKEEPRATTETADVTGDGVVDIADVNAAINAMLGKGQIPNGLSQVEYIDVTGGQWIDTGIHADSSIEVQFTTMVAGRMANNTRFFSTHDPHPDYPEYQYPETSQLYDGWNALGTWGLSAEPNEIKIKPLGYDDLVGTNCGISDFYNQKITLVLTGTGRFSLVKDNQTLKSYDAGSLTNTSTMSNTDIRLFTRVVYDAHELFKGKVYEVTITKSNQVVMHLLPYWDNNQDVGAFYDTVSKKFFYSNSSKSF